MVFTPTFYRCAACLGPMPCNTVAGCLHKSLKWETSAALTRASSLLSRCSDQALLVVLALVSVEKEQQQRGNISNILPAADRLCVRRTSTLDRAMIASWWRSIDSRMHVDEQKRTRTVLSSHSDDFWKIFFKIQFILDPTRGVCAICGFGSAYRCVVFSRCTVFPDCISRYALLK